MELEMKQLADVLQEAMRAESDGYAFYMMSANSTEDEKGKEIFQQLAKEEKGHMEYLKMQYQSIIDTGAIDPSLKLDLPMDFHPTHPIFTEKLIKRIGSAHFEMSALSIGVTLESNAFKFYGEQAEKTDNMEVKDFLIKLAEWEKRHYRALLQQQEMLKEDYWEANGFAPY